MHDSHHHGGGMRGLAQAFFLNLGFTLIEVAGGLWTNSVSVMTDAVHDFGDSLSLGLAWWLQKLAAKAADARFTYGYGRLSTLGALITAVVLLVGLLVMAWHAIDRLAEPQEVNSLGMMGLAVLGIAVNGVAALRAKGEHSLNASMVAWHLLEDVLGWAAVLAGSIAMSLWGMPMIDPLLSLMIAAVIGWNVARNLRKVGAVFLQRVPASFDEGKFQDAVRRLPKVLSIHHVHSWTIDGEHHVLSLHVVMKADSSREEIIEVKRRISHQMAGAGFAHVTIDVELEGEPCEPCH